MIAIIIKMQIYSDKTVDIIIIEKIFRSSTQKLNFIICLIKKAKNIDELSINELQSFLIINK